MRLFQRTTFETEFLKGMKFLQANRINRINHRHLPNNEGSCTHPIYFEEVRSHKYYQRIAGFFILG